MAATIQEQARELVRAINELPPLLLPSNFSYVAQYFSRATVLLLTRTEGQRMMNGDVVDRLEYNLWSSGPGRPPSTEDDFAISLLCVEKMMSYIVRDVAPRETRATMRIQQLTLGLRGLHVEALVPQLDLLNAELEELMETYLVLGLEEEMRADRIGQRRSSIWMEGGRLGVLVQGTQALLHATKQFFHAEVGCITALLHHEYIRKDPVSFYLDLRFDAERT